MYKVFVNDKPIILTNSLKKDNNFPVYNFKNASINDLLSKFKEADLHGVNLYCFDIQKCWGAFVKKFRKVKAAGGLVINTKNEVLFIRRNNKWDLPKGRMEKGESVEETAIREVEEECGIANLKIDKYLLKTHHIFFVKKSVVLKETDWFLMHSDYKGKLTPQLEEGITQVVFKTKTEATLALADTYENIKLVYKKYVEKI